MIRISLISIARLFFFALICTYFCGIVWSILEEKVLERKTEQLINKLKTK